MYPLAGPSTVRDAVGDTVLRVYSLEGAIVESEGLRWGLGALKGIDKRAQLLVYTDGLDMAAVDRYAYTRDVFMNMRATQVGGTPPSAVYDDTNIDDLVPSEADTPAPVELEAPAADTTSSLNQQSNSLETDDSAMAPVSEGQELYAELTQYAAPAQAEPTLTAQAVELAPAQDANHLALLY